MSYVPLLRPPRKPLFTPLDAATARAFSAQGMYVSLIQYLRGVLACRHVNGHEGR